MAGKHIAALMMASAIGAASTQTTAAPTTTPTAPTMAGERQIDQFLNICADAAMTAEQKNEKARSEGWMPAPRAVVADYWPPTMKLRDVKMWLKSNEEAMSVMLIGVSAMDINNKPIGVNFCAVGRQPADLTLEGAIRAWVGQAPLRQNAENTMYAFLARDGKRTPATAADFRKGHAVTLLMVGVSGKMSLVMYAPVVAENRT